MTQGITYRTRSYDLPRGARRASGSPVQAVLAALRPLWQGWPRWLPQLPDALVDDVAPTSGAATRRFHAEIERLDARLGIRLY